MKTLDVSESADLLAGYLQRVGQEPFVLTMDGQPVAAVVSLADVDWESLSLSTNPEFIAIIEQSRASLAAEGGISLEEVRKQLHIGEDPLVAAYAKVYVTLATFGGRTLSGCLFNRERDLLAPPFDDVEMIDRVTGSEEIGSIVATGAQGNWVAIVALAGTDLDADLDRLVAEAQRLQATPWFVVLGDVPEPIRKRAKQEDILLSGPRELQDLQAALTGN